MRKLTIYLFGAFVLWSVYHGHWLTHGSFPTQQACEAKAKTAADAWFVYWQVTRDQREDADPEQERNYLMIHKPLMNGKYSCWPEGRDLYTDPPPEYVRPWPTRPGG